MYEKYSFLAEEEKSAKTFTEALDVIKEREQVVLPIPYKGIAVTETGTIVLNGEERQITKWGFEKFCGMLGIPRPFARKIPEDLLNDNINRLLKEKPEEEKVLFFNAKKGLLGVGNEKADPFNNVDFLTQMATIHSSKMEVHDIIVNDRGVTVNFFTGLPQLEPKPGDITRVGFNTHNSDTGGLPTASHMFLYRLICSNGATMREMWGSAKRTYNRKITKETALLNFARETEEISTNATLLSDCFKKMLDTQVTDEYFKRCWTSVKRVVGSDTTVDEALEVTSDDRKEMFARIAKRKTENRKRVITGGAPDIPEILGRSYFDLYNQVTAMEKTYRLEDKYNLRRAGGDILSKMLRVETGKVELAEVDIEND